MTKEPKFRKLNASFSSFVVHVALATALGWIHLRVKLQYALRFSREGAPVPRLSQLRSAISTAFWVFASLRIREQS
ncbi:hypothetical protein TNCT_308591 [Trichonephila clavata]|uniref:Uncharacterized protein n=1 Tax=Trichonephila clavata TaxID=2740835 RepID=A0A8X6IMG8_TRICU|nr:hypothetical protein TNCT_308591 [Trichonephila clavata]